MYAKIASTTWTHNRPATSCVAGTSGEYAFEFEHELGCPMQGSTDPCTCYVSRIRLVKTPVGEFLPTTEPDLSTYVRFWYEEARRQKLWAVTFFGIAAVSTLLNVLYGLAVM